MDENAKVLGALLLVIAFVAIMVYSGRDGNRGEVNQGYHTSKIEFEGHKYILFLWHQGGGPIHDPTCTHPTHAGKVEKP